MTSVTTTSGVGGSIAGTAFLQATAASVSAAARTMAASPKIPRGIRRFRCGLIGPTIMLKCAAVGENWARSERLALLLSLVLVKRTRRIRDATQVEKERQRTVRRGRKGDPDHNPAGGPQAQGRSRRRAGRHP